MSNPEPGKSNGGPPIFLVHGEKIDTKNWPWTGPAATWRQKHVIFRASAANVEFCDFCQNRGFDPKPYVLRLVLPGPQELLPKMVFWHADTRKVRIAIRMTPKIPNGCFWAFLVLFYTFPELFRIGHSLESVSNHPLS